MKDQTTKRNDEVFKCVDCFLSVTDSRPRRQSILIVYYKFPFRHNLESSRNLQIKLMLDAKTTTDSQPYAVTEGNPQCIIMHDNASLMRSKNCTFVEKTALHYPTKHLAWYLNCHMNSQQNFVAKVSYGGFIYS
jgi:hypothetical protein